MVGLIYTGVKFVGGGIYKEEDLYIALQKIISFITLFSKPNLSLLKYIISRPYQRLPYLVHQLLPGLILQHLIYYLLTSCCTKYSYRQLASIAGGQLSSYSH